jgi:hypothetical protein
MLLMSQVAYASGAESVVIIVSPQPEVAFVLTLAHVLIRLTAQVLSGPGLAAICKFQSQRVELLNPCQKLPHYCHLSTRAIYCSWPLRPAQSLQGLAQLS